MADHEDKIGQLARNGIGRAEAKDHLNDALASYGLETESDPSIAIWKLLYTKAQIKAAALALPQVPTQLNAAPIESANFCTIVAGELIRQMIEERDWPLCDEAFRILIHLEKRLHSVAIPICLERMGQRFVSYPYLRLILGERARWLSRQRDSWLWLESMHHDSVDSFEGPFRSWWSLYIWHYSHRPEEMNQILMQHLENLDTREKQMLVEWISSHGDTSHLKILSSLPTGRSQILRRLVINTRLELLDPELHEEVANYAGRYMQKALAIKKNRIHFNPLKSQVAPEISFRLEDLNLFSDYFSDPLMQLLCLSDPTSWAPIKLDQHMQELMQDEHLENLAQIIVAGAVLHKKNKLIRSLAEEYFSHYPFGNTLGLNFKKAFAELTSRSFNHLLTAILKNTDRRFEKLGLIISEKSPYFSRKHSAEIIEHIVDALYYNAPHTEMIMLTQSLPFLATKIDPRVFPKLKAKLSQDATISRTLPKHFRSFLTVLERRANLLEALTLPTQ